MFDFQQDNAITLFNGSVSGGSRQGGASILNDDGTHSFTVGSAGDVGDFSLSGHMNNGSLDKTRIKIKHNGGGKQKSPKGGNGGTTSPFKLNKNVYEH